MLSSKLITETREAAGLSKADLARILGVTRQFIGDVESGKRPFPKGLVAKLPEPLAKPLRAALIDQMMSEVDRLMGE